MAQEQLIDSSLAIEKIENKVIKWIKKHNDELDDIEIDADNFKQIMISILGAYS